MGIDAENLVLRCGCRAELQAKLAAQYAESCPDASNVRAELQGYSLGVANKLGVVEVGAMDVKYSADWRLRSGVVKPKSYKGRMFFSYCPFCGRKAGNDAQLTYQVQSVKYLAGEVCLKTVNDAEVPESVEAGMRVALQKG